MKLFGSVTELTTIVFREDTQAVTVRPNQSTTYTASRTIEAPPGDTAHVLLSATSTQSVTNKTFDNTSTIAIFDSLFTLQDNGDATKQMQFQLSGITTGTTRTLTVPNASTTLVGTDTSQTLTSKTLTNPTISMLAGSLTIKDDSDPTKAIQLDVSSIGTGVTAILSIPNVSTGAFLISNATQAVTNKTIGTSNTINARDDRFTLADNADTSKIAVFECSGITTATTRTFTFPDNSGTLITSATGVDLSSVQTLQNKVLDNTNTVTLKDTLFTVQDDGDTTKQLRFQLSGITTGTIRTLTVPNASDTISVLGTAQTHTALKTFDAGVKLTTSGGTAATLDFYEEYTDTISAGAGATSGTVNTVSGTLRVTRIGKIVMITLDALVYTSSSLVGGISLTSNAIPARFRPGTVTVGPIVTVGFAGAQTGVSFRMIVSTAGVVTLGNKDNSDTAASVTNATFGPITWAMSYSL